QTAGVRTAFVGPATVDAPPFDIRLTTKRESGPIALKPVRRAVRDALARLDDAGNALLWIEIDALRPPWTVPDDWLEEFFAADTDGDEDGEAPDENAAIEPWVGDLPEWIGTDDDTTFQRLQRTYAASVAALDQALERLMKDCAKAGWGDDVCWLLTSDAGFPLGEHGAVGF